MYIIYKNIRIFEWILYSYNDLIHLKAFQHWLLVFSPYQVCVKFTPAHSSFL